MNQLFVKEGDKVRARQVMPILVNCPRVEPAYQEAQAVVKIAQITLEEVQSGAMFGEIEA
jgi:HlyD family secretion protein